MRLLILLLLLLSPALHAKQKESKAGAAEKKSGQTAQQGTHKSSELSMPPRLVIGTVERWYAQAERMFPALRAPDSEFHAGFQMAHKAMQENNPAFLLANDWPLRLAEKVARSMKAAGSTPLAAFRR